MTNPFDDALERIRLSSEALLNGTQWNRAWALIGVTDYLAGNDYEEGLHTAKEWNKGYEDHYTRGYNSAKERFE